MSWLLLLIGILLNTALAYETIEQEMASGNTLSITKFAGDGETLILWIPSERGYRKGSLPVTIELGDMGIDVHVVDLHTSYMLQTGNRSYEDFDNSDILELLEHYKKTFKEVFFVSSGRGAVVALQTARDWQLKYPDNYLLKGFIFTHPHFIEGRPEIGSQADYVAIAKMTNLPVYLFQPEFSTKYARSQEIANYLKQGGSSVFIHLLKQVSGGFYMRDEESLTEADLTAKALFASQIGNALVLLRSLPQVVGAAPHINAIKKEKTSSFRSSQLYPYKGNPVPPVTRLKTLAGDDFDLSDIKDEVILVNFWASWCGPCIEEIPSLNRLVARLSDKPFRVIAVNIGETPEAINDFLQQLGKTGIKLDFPVLLDEKGKSVRDWKVYAYPSNYLLDRTGTIRYAYRGALEWDAPHIVEVIERLF